MKDKNIWVLITALVCLTALEVTAILTDHDGYLFSLIVVAVAGIAGFKMPAIIKKIRK